MYSWQIIHSGSDLSSTVGQCLLKSVLLSINVLESLLPSSSILFYQSFVQSKLACQKIEVKTTRVRQRGFYYFSELQWEFQRLGWTPEICCGMITEWAVRSSLFSAPKAELIAMLCSCFSRMKRRYGIGKRWGPYGDSLPLYKEPRGAHYLFRAFTQLLRIKWQFSNHHTRPTEVNQREYIPH